MKKEIFLFPNAGGTIELFKDLCSEIKEQYDCFPFEYPGHGRNKAEQCNNVDELCVLAKKFFIRYHRQGTDYILLGYSMGTIIAMELLDIVLTKKTELPVGIVIAADPPENMIHENKHLSEEDNMKYFYMKNGHISEKVINSKLFREIYMPSFYNDYNILKKYDYTKLMRNKRACKALVLYCEEDTPFEIMRKWRECFMDAPTFSQYSGGHFFIKNNYRSIAKEILYMFG